MEARAISIEASKPASDDEAPNMGSRVIQETDCSSYLVGSFLGLTLESVSAIFHSFLSSLASNDRAFSMSYRRVPKVPDTLPINLEDFLAESSRGSARSPCSVT
jgi:hypothetical protein